MAVSDLHKGFNTKLKTLNFQTYPNMIDDIIAKVSLEEVQRNFNKRLDNEKQAPKMANVWPMERIWADMKAKDPQNATELIHKVVLVPNQPGQGCT